MTNNDSVNKEICELQRKVLDDKVNSLEKRVFEAVKQAMTVSEMSHSGNKESLQSLLNMMQEGAYEEIAKFENVENKIYDIDKAIKELEGNLSFFVERKEDIKKIQNLVTSLKLLKQAFETTKTTLDDKLNGNKDSIDKQLKHIRIALLLMSGVLILHLVAPDKSIGDLAELLFKALT